MSFDLNGLKNGSTKESQISAFLPKIDMMHELCVGRDQLKPNVLSSKGWSRLVAVAEPAHYFLPQTAVCGRKYWRVQDIPLLLRPTPMEIKKIIHFSNVIKQNQTTSRPQTTPWNNYSMLNDHIIFYFVSITNKNLDPTLLTTLCRPCTFLTASYASLAALVVAWNREGKKSLKRPLHGCNTFHLLALIVTTVFLLNT